MKRKLIIIAFIILSPVVLTAAMTSGSYTLQVGQDSGGGDTESAAYKLRGSVSGAVAGKAQSVNYVIHVGAVPRAGQGLSVISIESITRQALSTGDRCTINWHSAVDGDYYVEVGGNGSIASGTAVDSGLCSADSGIVSQVVEADLDDNMKNTIFIIVDDGTKVYYAAIVILDDQVPPDANFTKITVNGTVEDDTITEVLVSGVPVPVTGGQYQAVVNTFGPEIIIEATNSSGAKAQRKIRIQ